MRRFGRRFGRRARRRTVWITGFPFSNGQTDAQQSFTGNATTAPTTAGFLATAQVIGDPAGSVAPGNLDLLLAGGEEAVLTRIIGHLWFGGGKNEAGAAGGGVLRCAFVLREFRQDLTSIVPVDLWGPSDLGNEDILWMDQVAVSGDTLASNGATGINGAPARQFPSMLTIDVKAKRKLAQERTVIFQMQSATNIGIALKTWNIMGYWRTLLRAPARR